MKFYRYPYTFQPIELTEDKPYSEQIIEYMTDLHDGTGLDLESITYKEKLADSHTVPLEIRYARRLPTGKIDRQLINFELIENNH